MKNRNTIFTAAVLVLSGLAISSSAQATCQEGCDDSNAFLGEDALLNNTTGFGNSAIGWRALYSNTTGINNTANGAAALLSNSTGSFNTAVGDGALPGNTIGDNNTATGSLALRFNTTGSGNTASGVDALESNTTGYSNTATGSFALENNAAGSRNTANGGYALFANIFGINNTGEGFQALQHNKGSNNVGLGFNAGNSLTTGSGNVCIGAGVQGVAGESNTTRIKNVYNSVASNRAVYVNSDNKIGTLVSSRRFKEEIKPMDEASEAILKLKPVTFHYKKEIEPNGAIMFGLIAEEVERVAPDLVTRNDKGEAEAVRYDAVNAMLLNEFLKERTKVQQLEAAVAQQRDDFQQLVAKLKDEMENLVAHSKEQEAKIQQVCAAVELNKPAPEVAVNRR